MMFCVVILPPKVTKNNNVSKRMNEVYKNNCHCDKKDKNESKTL
tara:strand:+ start:281 stop:412 length:132 start_codon:yes stop_codon:yes gene_type:complete